MLGGRGGSDDDDGNNETDDSDLDKPGWRITREIMDRVDSSDWLRLELGDGSLRRMIFEIDEADLEASRSIGGVDAAGGGDSWVRESDKGYRTLQIGHA